jgi:hypothetical protein
VDFCLRTDDLTADTAAFRAAGVTISEPRAQSRVRPDGYRVAWVFSLPTGAHRGVAPFLIRDETPRDERVPRDRTQPNGVIGIGTVTVAVADVAPVRAWYARALGVPGEDVRREGVHGAGVRFTVGPHALEFLAPAGDQGPLAEHLAGRGPSPYGATLRTAAGRAGTLDPARARGARLTLVAA